GWYVRFSSVTKENIMTFLFTPLHLWRRMIPVLCLFRKMYLPVEGANKQVISSQADSLIKISRIWADFFPANTSNQPI
ncbi:hypothetical protein, partial [Escherichia coli]|uniref:hypothetical protein n=1 Tax=Escherichia coli TaxID=562 RepID=UPI001AD92A34